MRVDLTSPNLALISILKHPEQVITLDANFLIPPDRRRFTKHSFDFPIFQKIWLDPVFSAFSNIAIHEAVYDELIMLYKYQYHLTSNEKLANPEWNQFITRMESLYSVGMLDA